MVDRSIISRMKVMFVSGGHNMEYGLLGYC